jgi:hypothetical protein
MEFRPATKDANTRGVCEVIRGEGPNPLDRICEEPAALRYPAMGGGFMRLCARHGAKHRGYSDVWDGSSWQEPVGAAGDVQEAGRE